ncbi:unnamed protein product [Calicophoron daubneyi]|uniref:Uncharacterized protein n=1 Tax=Calicophoron daubneyi TaxID=300641 RepID=A0AAV2TD77_CALDB
MKSLLHLLLLLTLLCGCFAQDDDPVDPLLKYVVFDGNVSCSGYNNDESTENRAFANISDAITKVTKHRLLSAALVEQNVFEKLPESGLCAQFSMIFDKEILKSTNRNIFKRDINNAIACELNNQLPEKMKGKVIFSTEEYELVGPIHLTEEEGNHSIPLNEQQLKEGPDIIKSSLEAALGNIDLSGAVRSISRPKLEQTVVHAQSVTIAHTVVKLDWLELRRGLGAVREKELLEHLDHLLNDEFHIGHKLGYNEIHTQEIPQSICPTTRRERVEVIYPFQPMLARVPKKKSRKVWGSSSEDAPTEEPLNVGRRAFSRNSEAKPKNHTVQFCSPSPWLWSKSTMKRMAESGEYRNAMLFKKEVFSDVIVSELPCIASYVALNTRQCNSLTNEAIKLTVKFLVLLSRSRSMDFLKRALSHLQNQSTRLPKPFSLHVLHHYNPLPVCVSTNPTPFINQRAVSTTLSAVSSSTI